MSLTAKLYCRVPSDWCGDFSLCLFEWQTLIGGILALFAGIVTVVLLWRQIRQTEDLHNDELSRRHLAQRATLPLTLSEICRSAKDTLKQLGSLRRQSNISQDSLDVSDIITITDTSTVTIIQNLIENTKNMNLIRILCYLIQRLQISQSRLIRKEFFPTSQIDHRMIDIAQVYALAASLFNYARGDSADPPLAVEWDQVRTALNIAGLRRDAFPEVHALVDVHSRSRSWFWP